MKIRHRVCWAVAAAIVGAVLLPESSHAEKQQACSRVMSTQECGYQALVGDPDHPCITEKGKAYCPVYMSYTAAIRV